MKPPTLRVARPTDNLESLLRFYRDGLGLEVLFQFHDHDGFDGVMLGQRGAPWHLEFTHARDHAAGRAPTQDNLLVLYYPNLIEWESAVERMQAVELQPVQSFNPYWDRFGLTYEDPDGYRVVICHAKWEL